MKLSIEKNGIIDLQLEVKVKDKYYILNGSGTYPGIKGSLIGEGISSVSTYRIGFGRLGAGKPYCHHESFNLHGS